MSKKCVASGGSRVTVGALAEQVAKLAEVVSALVGSAPMPVKGGKAENMRKDTKGLLTVEKAVVESSTVTPEKVREWNANLKRTEKAEALLKGWGYKVVRGAKTTWRVYNPVTGDDVAVLKPYSARCELVKYVNGRKCYVKSTLKALQPKA